MEKINSLFFNLLKWYKFALVCLIILWNPYVKSVAKKINNGSSNVVVFNTIAELKHNKEADRETHKLVSRKKSLILIRYC